MPALVVSVNWPIPPEHMVLPENTETCGVGFTTTVTSLETVAEPQPAVGVDVQTTNQVPVNKLAPVGV